MAPHEISLACMSVMRPTQRTQGGDLVGRSAKEMFRSKGKVMFEGDFEDNRLKFEEV